MLRIFTRRVATSAAGFKPTNYAVRMKTSYGPVEEAAQAAGETKGTTPKV